MFCTRAHQRVRRGADHPAPAARRVFAAGFTLIELLVVIAIIAILAAILFPVFAQARAKARQTSCLSNQKQLGTAMAMYAQDYDESLAPVWTVPNEDWFGDAGGNWQRQPDLAMQTWVKKIEPYCKSLAVFRCPSIADSWGPLFSGQYFTWINVQYWPSIGFNYQYLSKHQTPPPGGTDPWYYRTQGLAAIVAPSDTVMFVDTTEPGPEGNYNMVIEPPDGYTSPNTYGWGGWGNDGTFGPYGNGEARHSLGMNVTFVDSHVKWMRPEALAAGTNWKPTMSQSQVRITDVSKYIWDADGNGG